MKEKKPSNKQGFRQTPGSARSLEGNRSWSTLEQQVIRMQKQIAQASVQANRQAVHRLQQRLMESEAARLLAVRRVTGANQGKDTAGVDGVKSLTSNERLAMTAAIHPDHWKHQIPMPVRRVWVPKPGTAERRPLAILPMIDRCKQALVKLALEPEWETKFEPHSYGFRPGRGARDAIASIVEAIEQCPMYVFDADIESAFDSVNQAVVLEKLQTFPVLRQTIATWLKAGIIDGNTYFSSETGIAQGGVLSPLLLNVALHGMEAVVTEDLTRSHVREPPLLIRYADDFVILHPDLKELQQAVRRMKHWLARIGLQVHADKTRYTHTLTPYQGSTGFDFLGFNIRQESGERIARGKNGQASVSGSKVNAASILHRRASQEHTSEVKTILHPSQQANKRHIAAIEQRLQQLQTAPQARVIAELNPLILGWANYYHGIVDVATMRRYDDLVEQRLLTWASKRHPGKARDWLLTRYWHSIGGQRRVFATPDGVQLRLYQQTSSPW